LLANEGSRKSSMRQPGTVSKYSDMLLVEIEPLSLTWFSSKVYAVVADAVSTEGELRISLEFFRHGWWFLLLVVLMFESKLLVEVDDAVCREEEAESFTPVRRNLLCFWVCSLALWIGRSHSLHRIALSSWQNRRALLSWRKITAKTVFYNLNNHSKWKASEGSSW
jgi:hypothetical protein